MVHKRPTRLIGYIEGHRVVYGWMDKDGHTIRHSTQNDKYQSDKDSKGADSLPVDLEVFWTGQVYRLSTRFDENPLASPSKEKSFPPSSESYPLSQPVVTSLNYHRVCASLPMGEEGKVDGFHLKRLSNDCLLQWRVGKKTGKKTFRWVIAMFYPYPSSITNSSSSMTRTPSVIPSCPSFRRMNSVETKYGYTNLD